MKKYIITLFLLMILSSTFAQNKFLSSRSDSIKKHLVGIRIGFGIDHILILNGQVGVYIMPYSSSKTRVSLENSVGLFIPWLIYERYYYPSIRLYQKIKKGTWVSCSYGKEFSRVTDLFDEPRKEFTRTINHRLDIGLIYEINDRYNLEFNMPIRIDEEIPIYLTGINVSIVFKI